MALCTHLETLNLSECSRLSRTLPLHLCTNIKSLDLSLCFRLKDFSSVFRLQQLEYLNVSGTKFTDVDLSKLYKLLNLREVDISKCYNIVYDAENKPDNLEIILDSLETGQVDWDDSDENNTIEFITE